MRAGKPVPAWVGMYVHRNLSECMSKHGYMNRMDGYVHRCSQVCELG